MRHACSCLVCCLLRGKGVYGCTLASWVWARRFHRKNSQLVTMCTRCVYTLCTRCVHAGFARDADMLTHLQPDSSDEDEEAIRGAGIRAAASGAAPAASARKKPLFDKNRVLRAVLGREAPGARGTKDENAKGCAQHLPSFFTDEVQQRWLDWAARTPSTLSDVPEEHRLRKCEMPQKCLPVGAAIVVEARVQRELLTYSNLDGRSIGKTTLARDAEALKPLYEHDVKIGSKVALKREPMDPTNKGPGGYNTPFYIGDVLGINYVAGSDVMAMVVHAPEGAACSSQSATVRPRRIESLKLHFRMPLSRHKFNDDVQKPWALACHGLHMWSTACEQRGECRRAAKAATGSASETAMVYVAEAAELMEADVSFTKSSQLTNKSRERLAEHGPADGSWQTLLGILGSVHQQKPSKRIRR